MLSRRLVLVGSAPGIGRHCLLHVGAVPTRHALRAHQQHGQPLLGAGVVADIQPVRIECVFSGTNALSAVSVEYFVDSIEVTNEARSTIAMTVVGNPGEGRFAAILPAQADRSVVRFRIRAKPRGEFSTLSVVRARSSAVRTGTPC